MTVAHLGGFKGLGNVISDFICASRLLQNGVTSTSLWSTSFLPFARHGLLEHRAAKRRPDVRQWMLFSEG